MLIRFEIVNQRRQGTEYYFTGELCLARQDWVAATVVVAETAGTAYPFHGVRAGPPAAATREPRQARKGAAVMVMSGAGVRLARILFCTRQASK